MQSHSVSVPCQPRARSRSAHRGIFGPGTTVDPKRQKSAIQGHLRCGLRVVLSVLLLATAMAMYAPGTSAQIARKCYTDRGKKICFPAGNISFADEVISYRPGKPFPVKNFSYPKQALGPPNNRPLYESNTQVRQNFVSLGCGGTLVVRFTDNALVDVPGPDLYVFEIGSDVEPSHLWISKNGTEWVDIGEIKGATAAIDISRFVKPGDQFRYVRLTDLKSRCVKTWGGADIDAVGAIGAVGVGAGYIRVVAASANIGGAGNVQLILDASGSMRGKTESGRSKIAVAREVLRKAIAALPNGARVGLRVYGHRVPSRRKTASCRDSQLLIPLELDNRDRLTRAINGIKPKGQTPIGYSLAQLEADFRGRKGLKVVLLVSDGIETCAPKSGDRYYPPSVVRALQKKGVKFSINVVGFGIGESKTRRFLRELARISGGNYFDARGARELRRALKSALRAPYTVVSGSGAVVARGYVGQAAVMVKPGSYRVVIESAPRIEVKNVVVRSGKEMRLRLRSAGGGVVADRSVVAH